MASSIPTLFGVAILTSRQKAFQPLQVRARNSDSDEGKPSMSMVDANLGVLKERIKMAKMEERLERLRVGSADRDVGWNYRSGYDSKLSKRVDQRVMDEFLEVSELVAGTFGLSILSYTLCICLVSFLVHLGC